MPYNIVAVREHIEQDPDSGVVKPTPFELLLSMIISCAKEAGLQKCGGKRIFEPVPNISCAYRKTTHLSYLEFVNDVVGNEPDCLFRPGMNGLLAKQLESHTNIIDFPEYAPTPGFFAFNDGVFDAKEMRFIPTAEVPKGITAVQYFDSPYPTGDVRTMHPNFDKVVGHQFETYDGMLPFVYIGIGHTLLPIHFKENWDIFMYYYGVRGTGKSTIIRIIKALCPNFFDIQDVPDDRFCLSGAVGCSVVTAEDANGKTLTEALPATVLNKMCEGGSVTMNRRYLSAAENDKWSAPIAVASNDLNPWVQDGITRRIWLFMHLKRVSNADINFERDLVPELPAILLHSLLEHDAYAKEHRFTSTPPIVPIMQQWRDATVIGRDPFAQFLQPDSERIYIDKRNNESVNIDISRVEGAVTMCQPDFMDAYKSWVSRNHNIKATNAVLKEAAVFANASFSVERRVLCKPSIDNGDPHISQSGCCAHYDRSKRVRRDVIVDMKMRVTKSAYRGDLANDDWNES